jgi:cytochrome P450
MEIRTALEQWLARIPEFRLAPDAQVRWSEGAVRGPRSVPVLLG